MIWLIFLFLAYVRADDDSLDFGPPSFPPRKNTLIEEQMSDEMLTAVRESFGGTKTTGSFAYPPMSAELDEHRDLLNECYENGMGAPKLYLFEETIWDIQNMEFKTVENGTIFCSPGYSRKFYYEYERTLKKYFSPAYKNSVEKYETSLKLYKNKISNADPERVHVIATTAAAAAASAAGTAAGLMLLGPAGIAAAAAAAFMATYTTTYLGACAYIPGKTLPSEWCGCGLTFPKIPCTPTDGQMILDNTDKDEWKYIHYPYNLENARDYAVSKIKQSYDMYQASPTSQAEYCRKWNTISGDGIEYFNPPKYITGTIGLLKKKIVWDTASDEDGWEQLKLYNSGGTDFKLNHWGSTALHAKVKCSHYGLTDVSNYNSNFIDHHPHIEASPDASDSCESDCKSFYLTENLDKTLSATAYKNAYLSFDDRNITVRPARPDDKLFCMRDHSTVSNNDAEERAIDMWVNTQIVSAQFAVFTWAQKHCKLYGGLSDKWTLDSDFSCLLGASDIVMKGTAQTVPLPSGFGAGFTYKKFMKQGISIIVRGKYSYCISTEEYAEMGGVKVTFSPAKFSAAKAKAKQAKAAATEGIKDAKKGFFKKIQETGSKNIKSYGKKLIKSASIAYVREKQTDIRNGFEGNFKQRAEYWLEEGSCGEGCSLTRRNDIDEAWNMVAGSLSFFSAKTSVSYIRAYEQTGDGDTGWDRYFVQLFAQVTIPNVAQVILTELDKAATVAGAFQISLEVAAGSATFFSMYDNFGNNPKSNETNVMNTHWLNQAGSTSESLKFSSTVTHETFMNTFTNTGQTPVNHRMVSIQSRRRLNTGYNIPDLALSDEDALEIDTTTPSVLDRRGIRHDFDFEVTGNIGSLIHGVQDVIEHNNILSNPFVYTKLNESTLELQYRGSPYHIATLRSCEAFGYVSVQLIDHEFNTGLQPILDYMQNTGKIDTKNLHSNTFTYSDRGGLWSYIDSEWTYNGDTPDIHTIGDETIDFSNTSIYENTVVESLDFSYRPSGLIIGPMREEGYRDLRQTMDNFNEVRAGRSIKQHSDCSDNMPCVCVLAEGFAYVKYGDIKHLEGHMIHPIYSNYQCHLAKMHIQTSEFSFQQWNEVLEGPPPQKIAMSSIATTIGCVMHSDEIKFNTAGTKGTIVDNSIVKLYKIIDPQNSFDYAGDTINVHRQSPFDIMREKHTAIDTKFHMVEDGQPVRFPRHDFGALKDKNALHTMHGGTFKTIRRVDRYYKKNVDVVEEYYIAEDGGHMIEYLNLRTIDPKSNEYGDTTLIPSAHFVANIDDIGTDILVPQMDFVRNGLVAFSGQNINMPQLPCRSLFDYSGPAKYYDDAGASTDIPGLKDVICGEVAPQLAEHVSCEKSLSLPNTCPAGYGMDGEGTDDDGYAFDLGDKRQCAKCPVVPTCNGVCERCLGTDSDTCENPQVCKECLSPSGSYRCEVDLTNCDKPGYVETFVRRGGPDAQVSRHCVKTFEEPAHLPWQASTLQKHHHRNGNPFYPHEHPASGTANGMKWIQNEIYSETRYLVCNPGFVPTQEIFDPADTDTLVARITQYRATCAGYTCKRCPDGFYEEDQICMKCPNRQIANAAGTGCEDVYVPTGHFFDVTNSPGFISSCDHWLDHPGGSMGAYQDEENQIVCKTVNTTVNTNLGGLGRHDVMFKGGIVDIWGVKGWRVSQDRTAAVQCEDHQRCNGEEVSGCTHGYIWKEYSENKDIDPCEQCNVNEDIKSEHPSTDAYEICDGTHRFRCAVASYTEATPDTFQTHIAPHHQAGDIFVGVRASWNGSSLVLPKSEVRGSLSASFKWKNDFNSNLPRAEHYVHNPNFQPRRVTENPAFNQNGQCRPVPNGTFALPDLWQKTDCGAAKALCVDRTFHKIIPYKKDCVDADKYAFTAGVVKEECYDEIFRGESRTCTNGEKLGDCNREPCQEEGATNCWCADEPDFCTMGCVNDLCQEICGDRVCEEYELCYGEFDQFVSFARCAIECQPPISNYCVIRDGENTKYCRHYNVNWNSTILKKAYQDQDTPCFDEVPNIPETQCIDEFATSCFCGREYFDPPHTHESDNYACVNQVIEPVCSVPQDDGTCIYETSSSGECICGSDKIDLWNGETCYKTSKCGLNARPRPLCEDVLGSEIPCIAADYNIVDNVNCYNGNLKAVYETIDSGVSYKCEGTGEDVYVRGCVDEKGNNHNAYATVPWICNYN